VPVVYREREWGHGGTTITTVVEVLHDNDLTLLSLNTSYKKLPTGKGKSKVIPVFFWTEYPAMKAHWGVEV
jgi:hypothetical protein